REPRLRRVLVAEHAEGDRPAVRTCFLHDEIFVDGKRFQLRRLADRGGAAALRWDEDPPTGGLLGTPVREARSEGKRLERLLGALRVGDGEAAPFHAF